MTEPIQADPLLTHVANLAARESELYASLMQAAAQLKARDKELETALQDLKTQIRAAPHNYAASSQNGKDTASDYLLYQQLIGRIREIVRNTTPPNATVIVVSRGDEELLKLDGRTGWHFPQTEDGIYAGYYPADSAAAITELETLRARGGDFVLFPSTTFWWLDYYPELKQHLDANYPKIVERLDACIIYCLHPANSRRNGRALSTARRSSGVRRKNL